MITKIPENEICQAFDPRMHKSNEELRSHGAKEQPNTSCLAPAYIYVEGKHGKKFLCDYHYYYELRINKEGYQGFNKTWKEIFQYIVDETERVKETFAKNITTTETLGHKCCLVNYFNPDNSGCTADALVKVTPTGSPVGKINFNPTYDRHNPLKSIFYCNFHYRRTYYRFLNNGVVFEDYHKIVDERYRMKMTLNEEAEKLTYM